MKLVRKEHAKTYYLQKRGGGGGRGGRGGSAKTMKDFAFNDITEQKLPLLAKGTRDRR